MKINNFKKKKKGSNRAEPNQLSINYNNHNKPKYLNLSHIQKINKKNKEGIIPQRSERVFQVIILNTNKYINIINKKKKEAFDDKKMLDLAFLGSEKPKVFQIAPIVRYKVFTDLNTLNPNNYINLSYYNTTDAEDASVALIVRQRPDEPCLHRLPGANPGWGGSASLFSQKSPLILSSNGGVN